MSDWNTRSIDDLCTTVTSGGTPNRSRADFYSPPTIPWIKTGDLNDSYVTKYSEYISEDGLAASSAKLLPVETVLLAMYGATVGKLGMLREPATCNQAACAMVANPAICDSRWLFYTLFNDRARMINLANGAAQQNLSGTTIKKFQLSVPPLVEQQAIAEVLGALDDKIAANTKFAATVEALGTAKLEALGINAEPENGAVSLDTLIDFNPRRTATLSTATLIDMQALPTSTPLIEIWSEGPKKGGTRFMNGDTLLARITPCLENRKTGFVDFLDDNQVGIGSTEFIVMRSREGLPLGLSYFLATSSRFRDFAIQNMVGTSGRQRVATTDVARFEFNPIDRLALVCFGRWADKNLCLLGSLRTENRRLASTRDALLPQLMSGKLRVKDVEELVAAAV